MIKHANIPVFIPHLGCPNNCVFCNQRRISGALSFDEARVPEIIEKNLQTIENAGGCRETEIAFFGGSFTGIDRGLMIRLLKLAYSYIEAGRVSSIRLSTRPDYIDEEILGILGKYGVRHIELGIQSMDDEVLRRSKRGHTAEDTEKACALVKKYGFELVGQMMIGLPGADAAGEVMTAEKICEMGASAARVYPTAVFGKTELDEMRRSGNYLPLTPEDGAYRTSLAVEVFHERRVKLLRVGLCESDGLYGEDGIVAGANEPAIGEIAESLILRRQIERLIGGLGDVNGKILTVCLPKSMISRAVGHRGMNKNYFIEKYNLRDFRTSGKSNGEILVYRKGERKNDRNG